MCFDVYQQRKNKSKKSRRNITEKVIKIRTLAIQMEPTNPQQRYARQKVDSDKQELLHAHGRLENIRSLPNELRNPGAL